MMPQLFQVLRCYKCLAFQVHHSKKSNKFLCKICNEKQSIKRHYGVGIAKDCRMHVQKLNKLRGEKDDTILEESSEECRGDDAPENRCEDITYNIEVNKKRSKWLTYVDVNTTEAEDNQSPEEDREIQSYNSRRQNKNMYSKYKSKRKSSISRRDKDTDLECSYIENVIQDRDKSDSNISYERNLLTTEEDCTLRDNDSAKHNVNQIKRPTFEPPVVAKTSKWANFIEEDENIENNITHKDNKDLTHNIQPMFSLCDESDIDDVLNI